MKVRYTPTEKRLLAMLSDGLPHTRGELRALLWDELGTFATLQVHLSNIRKRLRPGGQDILCEYVSRRICYRQIHLLRRARAVVQTQS